MNEVGELVRQIIRQVAMEKMNDVDDNARLFAFANAAMGDVFPGSFVSDELNAVTRDNHGVVRPRHVREFPGGLWQMIEENGFSRVFLGVHWSFDAFALDAKGVPDLKQNVGGVPLGIAIAEDIWQFGNKLGPKSRRSERVA